LCQTPLDVLVILRTTLAPTLASRAIAAIPIPAASLVVVLLVLFLVAEFVCREGPTVNPSYADVAPDHDAVIADEILGAPLQLFPPDELLVAAPCPLLLDAGPELVRDYVYVGSTLVKVPVSAGSSCAALTAWSSRLNLYRAWRCWWWRLARWR
jgi:hypothetical protein